MIDRAQERKNIKSVIREYGEAILIAVVLALLIRTFIVQAFKIPSGSMIPTLLIGDHILVNKFIYGSHIPFTDATVFAMTMPKRGDVIVFKYPDDETKDFIKRVIGEPGDTLEVKDKAVYVNGKALNDEHYAIHQDPTVFPRGNQPRDNMGPIVVPEGDYFVMGDNRDQSLDSRFWGFVKADKIKGRAFRIYWSCDAQESWVCLFDLRKIRWNRIGKAIQ
ncbi:MAG TPA: signal peptidase I [Nitrospiria bacterium]|nr:signal peptidase I [Nitrospiria bacterium]